MTLAEKQDLLNTYYAEVLALKTFLSNTDYQTIREAEGGDPMSEETREKRAESRSRINELDELIKEVEAIIPEEPERPDEPIAE